MYLHVVWCCARARLCLFACVCVSVRVCPCVHYLRACIGRYFKGQGGGVATWEARPDVFPNGLNNFYAKTNWTGMLHNR